MSDKWPKDVQVATLARKLLENHPVWIGSSRYSKEERSKAKEAVGGLRKVVETLERHPETQFDIWVREK